MALQDDLTAERAAQLYNSLHAYVPTDRCVYASELNQVEVEKVEDITKLTAALKTARQEALREAARVICPYCAAPDRWSAMNEYGDHESRETKPSRNGSLRPCSAQPILDRLASEGAPEPIDLLPKLNDDGSYGEHF